MLNLNFKELKHINISAGISTVRTALLERFILLQNQPLAHSVIEGFETIYLAKILMVLFSFQKCTLCIYKIEMITSRKVLLSVHFGKCHINRSLFSILHSFLDLSSSLVYGH